MLTTRGLLHLKRSVGVEVLHEVFLPRVPHLIFELNEVIANWLLLLNQFPGDVLAAVDASLYHVVVIIDLEQPGDDLAVVWHVCILKLVNVHHDLLDLLHALGRPNPELPLRLFKALCLDLLDLGDRVVSLLSPLKFLIQKVEHGKVKTPHIVASG